MNWNAITAIIALFALFVSIASFVYTWKMTVKQQESNARFAATLKIAGLEYLFGDYPNLLRFHGFENPEQALQEHGLTPKEFAYLMASFTTTGVFYNTTHTKTQDRLVKHGSYRDNMFSSKAMRKAWPLVRKLLADTKFRDEMDKLNKFHDEHWNWRE